MCVCMDVSMCVYVCLHMYVCATEILNAGILKSKAQGPKTQDPKLLSFFLVFGFGVLTDGLSRCFTRLEPLLNLGFTV